MANQSLLLLLGQVADVLANRRLDKLTGGSSPVHLVEEVDAGGLVLFSTLEPGRVGQPLGGRPIGSGSGTRNRIEENVRGGACVQVAHQS